MNSTAHSIAHTLPTDALAAAFMDRIGDDLIPVKEAARRAGRTPERVGQMIRDDRLPAIHITLNGRGAYLIRQADLAAWISGVLPSEVA